MAELEDAPWAAPAPLEAPQTDAGKLAAYGKRQLEPQATTPPTKEDGLEDAPWAAKPMSWSEVPGKALQNAPGSAVEFGKNVAAPFVDAGEYGARGIDWLAQKAGAAPRQAQPTPTFDSMAQLGGGVLQKLGLMEGDEYKGHADAVGRFLMDRYGSVEGIKKTLATDPVGMAADVSTVLTAGGSLAARAPGMAGRVGEIAATAGRVVDPLTAPLAALKGAGHAAAGVIGNLGTHTGTDALVEAARAGAEGGSRASTFRANIRGIAPTEDAVMDVQGVLGKMRIERGAEYKAAMAKLGKRTETLEFDKIDSALADSTKVQTYKGRVLDPGSQAIREKIGQVIQEWKMLPKAEYHTPEGMDAMKREIGFIRDNTLERTPERVIADKAYNAIGATIRKEAPEYDKIMRGYQEASKQLKTLEQELSVPTPNRGNVDTSLRKMQRALRNNVNANFGRRKELVKYLVDNGAPNLMAKLAGQSLHPVFPRGLGKLAMSIGAEMTAVGALATGAGAVAAGKALAAAPLFSPRAMGETAYWGGVGARNLKPARKMVLPAFQVGRAGQQKSGGRIDTRQATLRTLRRVKGR